MGDNIERCLRERGYVLVPTKGTSMWPLLQEGRNIVQLAARDGRSLKAGDVVLYRREDNQLVLHRIIRVAQADTYLLCGDHQWKPCELVRNEQILAVAQGFIRDGRSFDEHTWWYRLYQMLWNRNLTVRRFCLALLRVSGWEKRSCQF